MGTKWGKEGKVNIWKCLNGTIQAICKAKNENFSKHIIISAMAMAMTIATFQNGNAKQR